MVEAALDQHPHLGRGLVGRVDDAHLVVHQVQVGELREGVDHRVAQGLRQRVDRAVALADVQLGGAVDLSTLMIGLSKAPIFAAAIAIIGCYEGFKVGGSAASVGRRTTTSVVEAIFMVILIDAAFAIALSWLDI